MHTITKAALAAGLWATSAFASLIPIGLVPSTGNGLGAVLSVVTFSNTGTEFGCIGVNSSGAATTGSTQCVGVTPPGGVTHEQTGAGNNVYTASFLSLTPTGSNTFGNLVLTFNGNEGGGADQPIILDMLALNLFSPTGAVLGSFTTTAPYNISAFTGTGNAGFGFQLDATQAAQANAILAANPNLIIGASAGASNANSGNETVFISRIDSVQPGGDPGAIPEPSTMLMLGTGLIGLAVLRRRRQA